MDNDWKQRALRAAYRVLDGDGKPTAGKTQDGAAEWPEDQRGDAYEPPHDDNGDEPQTGYHLETQSSKDFFQASYQLEWLVQRLLVARQPAVLGGPKKTLKTSILVDLAVSLATGTPFLGRFQVYKPRRIVLISGESGEAVLQEVGRRVCASRGIVPEETGIHWSFRLPQAGNAIDRRRLCQGLRQLRAEVVFLDPLYLALMSGMDARHVEAGNLYGMGPLLLNLGQCCLDAGATPTLCHHAKKHSSATNEPLDLDDLSYGGIAEYARQWLLVNRREPFDASNGSSKLWLSAGGSAGQSGCWAVDVEEGVLGDDFDGRVWDVTVHAAGEQRAMDAEQSNAKQRQKRQDRERDAEDRFMAALDKLDRDGHGVSMSAVRTAAGLSGDKAAGAAFRLEQVGIIDIIPGLEVAIGSGAKRKAEGVRRRETS